MGNPVNQPYVLGPEADNVAAVDEAVSNSRMSLRAHIVKLGVIALVMLALFWRVIFLGETLIDVATLDNQLPWGYYAGESSDYPYNRRDLTDMYVTRDYFVVAAYRDGEMPLWNPYTMAGHPIYADGVTRMLSPLLLLYTVFDVPLGYSIARIIELFLAAIFMYIFLIGVGASASGGLAGSLVFALSAHSMFHLTQLGWWGGLMWLPLIFLFADRAITRKSFIHAIIAGVFLALQFFFGFLPTQIYYVGALLLYYLFFAFRPRASQQKGETVTRRLMLSLAMAGVTFAVGFGLAATQWVPVLELLQYSNRRIIGMEWGYIYLPPWYAATLFFPHLFGAAYDAKMVTLFTAINVSHDHIIYLGIAALLPLGFSVYSYALHWRIHKQALAEGRTRDYSDRVAFFLLLLVFALVMMMAAPLYVPLTKFIPILQVIRVAVRAGVLYLFAASVLIAYGTDALLRADAQTFAGFARQARKALIVIVAAVIASTALSYILRLTGFAADTSERGRVAFLRRAAEGLSSQFTPPNKDILIPLAFLFAAVALVVLTARGTVGRKTFFAALVLLLAVDLFWNGSYYNQSFDRARVFPQTKITELLSALPPGRVLVTPSGLLTNRRAGAGSLSDKIIAPPNTLLPYKIANISGKNQLFPRGYREFAALVEPQPHLSHVVFDEPRSRYFDLLNVRYVMTQASQPPIDGYDHIATEEGVALYENKTAMPRAFFVSKVVEVENRSDALAILADPNFDLRASAVIEQAGRETKSGIDSKEVALLTRPVPQAKAEIVEAKRNQLLIETENETDALLVLSDNHYPGWLADVDGRPTKILRANYTMRAVEVPAGRHVVSFRFMPAPFRASAYASMAMALVVPAAIALLWFNRRRPGGGQE